MKLSSFISLLFVFFFALAVNAAPLPLPANGNDCGASCQGLDTGKPTDSSQIAHVVKRQSQAVLPLPAAGESLLSYLDRLLSKLPLLGNLLEGLGYVRPK
ncbi:hypothetical protein GGF43_000362 [Coemansia sp. RSA 2618]|nr:hypothetical protein GGF43_000362 [Coemansia sp. RSA 2618]